MDPDGATDSVRLQAASAPEVERRAFMDDRSICMHACSCGMWHVYSSGCGCSFMPMKVHGVACMHAKNPPNWPRPYGHHAMACQRRHRPQHPEERTDHKHNLHQTRELPHAWPAACASWAEVRVGERSDRTPHSRGSFKPDLRFVISHGVQYLTSATTSTAADRPSRSPRAPIA